MLSWSAWLQREWQSAQFASPLPLLLDAQQELALWEGVVQASSEAARLLHADAIARAARDAWAIACAHRLSDALDRLPQTDETHAFLAWRDSFLRFCVQQHLIDGARLPDELAHQFAVGNLGVPGRLVMFGFDGMDPQRYALMGGTVRLASLRPT